ATIFEPETEDLVHALADADLADEERRTIELIDGQRSLADVGDASPLSERHVCQLAWTLVALGLARRRGEAAPTVGPPPAPRLRLASATGWSSRVADPAL